MSTKSELLTLGCHRCGVTRRRFLAGCAACAAGASALAVRPLRAAQAEAAKPKVRLVFTFVPSDRPIWPNIGYDFERRKRQLLEALSQGCPNVELLPVDIHNGDEARKLLEGDEKGEQKIDGYLVYMLGLWTGAPQVIAAAGRPTIFADDLYGGSGEFLIANAAARRAGFKTIGLSTSSVANVAEAVRAFEVLKKPGATVDDFLAAVETVRRKGMRPAGDLTCCPDTVCVRDVGECLKKLKESTILCVGRDPDRQGKAIEEIFGTKVLRIEFGELDEAYQKADSQQARKFAEQWAAGAEKIIEPSREEIDRSGAMYLAMRELLARHGAQAIAINCLGGFYGGHIKAYPCIGFSQFNNDGLVGACEADLHSTITMLAMGYLVGRPGYISDPVIDTSKNQIIYAHCVAPTKVFGPQGPSNPYHLRDHSEDRKGAVVRSLMPLGYMTTTLEVNVGRKEMICHQGKSVENVDEDMACRNKLAVEVKGDMDKLLSEWDRWGWHRVTFYGDLKGPAQELCKALGLTFLEEA